MDDAASIDLEEYKQLRAEIVNRTTLGNQVVSYAITAVAAGVAASQQFPEALLGVAVIVNFFWLMWIDHTGQVFKAASYIGVALAPRLQRLGRGVLEWEQFRRRLDAGSKQAAAVLYGLSANEKLSGVRIIDTRATSLYVGIVLGSSTLVFLITYVFLSYKHFTLPSGDYSTHARWVFIGCTLALWFFAIRRAWLLRVMTKCLDDAILSAQMRPTQGEGGGQSRA